MTSAPPAAERLAPLMAPASVAVIGASEGEGKFTHLPITNLRRFGFSGEIHPVNRRGGSVDGIDCRRSIDELPPGVDHAIIALRAELAADALRACARRGVRAATVIASGFSELEGADAAVIAEMGAAVAETGIPVCGPNSLGVANFNHDAVPLASSNLPPPPIGGGVAVVSQSGSCGFTLLNRAWSFGVGVGYLAVAGNELGTEIPDYIDYLAAQADVDVVVCYIESFRDPERFRASAEGMLAAGKPLVVMHSGRSDAGRRAAASHSGALSAEGDVVSAVLRRLGVVEVSSLDGLVLTGGLLARHGLAPGNRVGVYAQGGGAAVVMADLLSARGIELPRPAPATGAALKELLSDTTPGNPFDSGGRFLGERPGLLAEALTAFAADPSFDVMAYFLMPSAGIRQRQYAGAVVESLSRSGKPSIVLQYRAGELTRRAEEMLRDADQLAVDPPESGVDALAAWLDGSRVVEQARRAPTVARLPAPDPAVRAELLARRDRGQQVITEADAHALLSRCGLRAPGNAVAHNRAEAAAAAESVGYPVVLKTLSRHVPHRARVGAIAVGLQAPDAVQDAYDRVTQRVRDLVPAADDAATVLVGKQVEPGLELYAGVRDSNFGPIVTFGLGGVWVEAVRDVVLRPAPVAIEDARAMLTELRAAASVAGWLADHAVDGDEIARVICAVGAFAHLHRDLVAEVDINPVVVNHDGVWPVDALITLH